jgi:hypothetical protein
VQSEMYQVAIEIAITEAEWGESPYDWSNCPFNDIRYTLSDSDVEEAAEMLNPDPIEEFEEFIGSLDDTSFCEATRAMATIRATLLRFRLSRPDTTLDMKRILAAF